MPSDRDISILRIRRVVLDLDKASKYGVLAALRVLLSRLHDFVDETGIMFAESLFSLRMSCRSGPGKV